MSIQIMVKIASRERVRKRFCNACRLFTIIIYTYTLIIVFLHFVLFYNRAYTTRLFKHCEHYIYDNIIYEYNI